MIYEFSNKISCKLVDKKIIKEDDTEVYTYGFEIIISSLLILFANLILGIIFNCLLEVVIYMVFFCILRIQAGGYHAKTHTECFSYFTLSCFAAIILSHLLVDFDKSNIIVILILIESCIVTFNYAPVDTVNKPFKDSEVSKYRKRSIITVIAQSIVILTFSTLFSSLQLYYMVAALAVFIETVTLLPIINNPKKVG